MKKYRISLHQTEYGLRWVVERRKFLLFWKAISQNLTKRQAEAKLEILKKLFEKNG